MIRRTARVEERVELTPAERRAYAALRRDAEVNPSHEDRTVAALRTAGLFGAGSSVARPALRESPHAMRLRVTIIAAAAILVIIVGTSTLLRQARRDGIRGASPYSAASPTIAFSPAHENGRTSASPDSTYLVWY